MRNALLNRTQQGPKNRFISIYIPSRLMASLTAQTFPTVHTLDNGLFGHFEKLCCHLSKARKCDLCYKSLTEIFPDSEKRQESKLPEHPLTFSTLYNTFQHECAQLLLLSVLCEIFKEGRSSTLPSMSNYVFGSVIRHMFVLSVQTS